MPGRKNVSYSGYVIPSTGELIVTKPERFNYETVIQSFRDFIEAYEIPNNKKICMIIDNAPWHKKAYRLIYEDLCDEYKDIRDKLVIIKLPPYSPDLNPIEQCWRITRREVTHNTFFSSTDALTTALDSFFQNFRLPNPKLSRLCSFKYKN